MRFLLLLPLLLFASCSTPSSSTGRSELGNRPGPRGFRTVVIDAGHGGSDTGARSRITGDMEKTLALDTARRVQSELGGSFRTVLLRNDDTFIDLDERVVRASRSGDVLVSIHYNSGPSGIRGPESFYWRVDSYSLAKRLQRELSGASGGGSGNRGLVRRRLRLTRNPSIPCVLVECGYLSNPAEARLCANAGYRQRIARVIAAAIREQAAKGDEGMGPLPRHIDAPPSRATDARE
ncbi:MAG TPA: N-acetylmuramoyl-L-alanine amidase [Verrucomicrobiales bacterium]|nr:N-acetylmuramoyl-L-alanine amidase [Verrucomicrobiales bacterium]